MKRELLEVMRNMAAVDIKTVPNFLCMIALTNRLQSLGMNRRLAETVVAKMTIQLTEFSSDNLIWSEIVALYGTVVYNMYLALDQEFVDPDAAIVSFASQLSLKCD